MTTPAGWLEEVLDELAAAQRALGRAATAATAPEEDAEARHEVIAVVADARDRLLDASVHVGRVRRELGSPQG